ncbi:hypothetical protein KFZ56_15485 [Virgibacillus sp. NKC19-3]|uniref:hypothetical protein n=1 Tax=Virgibacillus saliphilus TaxID=2831674 RepID=UPI001C9AE8D6|nr:hypothetical protein [Virgibacillus sp. NKC19-3]MBY7144425.1 hypothetical protein [Virgibacillus sp. NKC19-3]
MNVEVLILFINATLVTVISSIVVIVILRKQYLPVIRKAEQEEEKVKELDRSDKHQSSS